MSMHPLRNYFKEFPNEIFIETGSYHGGGIMYALDAGFQHIISVDQDKNNLLICKERFEALGVIDKIQLVHGNSGEQLPKILSTIDKPCTFWLDAHGQFFDFESQTENLFPLFEELSSIAGHHIKTHTILIDDILHLTHPDVTGWDRNKIEAAIKQINPLYKIEYRSNPVMNNILIASC